MNDTHRHSLHFKRFVKVNTKLMVTDSNETHVCTEKQLYTNKELQRRKLPVEE